MSIKIKNYKKSKGKSKYGGGETLEITMGELQEKMTLLVKEAETVHECVKKVSNKTDPIKNALTSSETCAKSGKKALEAGKKILEAIKKGTEVSEEDFNILIEDSERSIKTADETMMYTNLALTEDESNQQIKDLHAAVVKLIDLSNSPETQALLRQAAKQTAFKIGNKLLSLFTNKESGKEESGKEESGKEESGKEESGKEESGKEESGKEESGKEESGKEESGKEESEKIEADDGESISFEEKFRNLYDALFDHGDFSENETIMSIFNKKIKENKDGIGEKIKDLVRKYNKSSIDIISNIQEILGFDNDGGQLITTALSDLFEQYLEPQKNNNKNILLKYYKKIKNSDRVFDSQLKDFIKEYGITQKDIDSFVLKFYEDNFNEEEDINCGIEDELNDLEDDWEKIKPLLRSRVCCYKRYIAARNVFWGTCADIMTGQNILSKKILMHGKKIIGTGMELSVLIQDTNIKEYMITYFDQDDNKKLQKYSSEIESIARAKIKLNNARDKYDACMKGFSL